MTRVLAFDLSLTKSGVCYPPGSCDTLKPPPKVTGGERLLWWATTFDILLDDHRPDRVVAEAPFTHGAHGKGSIELHKVYGCFEAACAKRGVVVTWVWPSTLKKKATLYGGATKAEMVARAQSFGYDVANDDEADAALLAHGVAAGWWDE